MKRFMVFCASILFSLIAGGSIFGIEGIPAVRVTGKIDSVTIFSDRAVVLRIQQVELAGESGKIRFYNLPAALLRDSVRASAEGVTITGVAVRPIPPLSDDAFTDHPLKLDVDRLDREIRSNEDSLAVYRDQLSMLGKLAQVTASKSDQEIRLGSVKTTGWLDAIQFLETQRSAYHEKIRKTDFQQEKLRKERMNANNRYQQLLSGKRNAQAEVEVSYSGKAGTHGKINLEYTVTSVAWTGLYDLRGSAEGGTFSLVSHANIRQSSGEAWTDAKITLSTARPSAGTTPGVLQPWRISSRHLLPPGGSSSNRLSMNKSIGSRDDGLMSDTEGAAEEPEMSDINASTSMTVTLPGRETIASDNSDHRVTLSSTELKGTLFHIAIPSLSGHVYLRARLRNSSSMPLLWGTVNVFLDGNFIGVSNFSHHAAVGEEFDIYLGTDQRFQAKRTIIKSEPKKSWGLGAEKVEIENQWQIEIANYSGKVRQLTVQDQIPVTADPNNIVVKFLKSSRENVVPDPNGILTWKIELKPGEKQKIDFSYAITIPQEVLNRFEQDAQSKGRARGIMNEDFLQKDESPNQIQKQNKMYNIEQMMRKK